MLNKTTFAGLLLISTFALVAQASDLGSSNSPSQNLSCVLTDSIETQAEQLAAEIVYKTAKPWLKKHGFNVSKDPSIDGHLACHSMGEMTSSDDGNDGYVLADDYCDYFVVNLKFSDGTPIVLDVYGNAAPTGGNGVFVQRNVYDSLGNLESCELVFPKIIPSSDIGDIPDAGSYVDQIYNAITKDEFFEARGSFTENIPIPAGEIIRFAPTENPAN